MSLSTRTLVALIALSFLAGPAISGDSDGVVRRAPDEILITCRVDWSDAECRTSFGAAGHTLLKRFHVARESRSKLNRAYLVRIPDGRDFEKTLDETLRLAGVEAAQPNYLYRALDVPNDPYFPLQWGLDNPGGNSAFDPYGGLRGPDPRVPGADMDVPEARGIFDGWTSERVRVAVIDTGVDYSHPDLAPNIWTNPGEIPGNGVDDDSNGLADDVHGWDFVDDDNDPDDPTGHGTHAAGIIGAMSNNGAGVAGVATDASLIPMRVLDVNGSGYTGDIVDAILHSTDFGADVINLCLGDGPSHDPLLESAIQNARDDGTAIVAAAGNDDSDNDLVPHYPSGYPVDNIIAVGASTAWADRADFSNYGTQTVHIFAPGDEIISTRPVGGDPGIPETEYQICYLYDAVTLAPWSGTSMAAPAVSAAAATLFAYGETLWPATWPAMTPVERMTAVRTRILERSDRWASLSGLSTTGGHLNLLNLVEDDITPPEPCGPSLGLETRGQTSVTMRWAASGDDGTTGTANYYDLRYQPGPTIDFATAIPVRDVWTPGPPGFVETYTLTGLMPDTQYTVGIEVVDNAGNRSPLTQLTLDTWPDSFPPPVADVPVFEDGFHGNDCGNWQLAGDWGCELEALSDSPGLTYPFNNRASAQLPPLSFEGTDAVGVSFTLAAFDYEQDHDFLYFEYSLDGVSWRVIERYTGAASGPQAFDLSVLTGQPEVHLRFRSLTDYVVGHDGALIDDFIVMVSDAPGCNHDADCDDGNSCTIDVCDPMVGACTTTFDPTCADGDSDGVDDAGDNCGFTPNGPLAGTCVSGLVGAPCLVDGECATENPGLCSVGQENLDGDGDGDACDPDQDGDGIDAGAGDCDDRSGQTYPGAPEICDGQDNDCDTVIDNAPPPGPVPTLSLTGDDLAWDPVADATAYDIVVGDLGNLTSLGIAATLGGCLVDDEPANSAVDSNPPPPGGGFWYLVRSANCGGPSSYGSGHPPQSPTRDEAIAVSGIDCLP